MLCLWHNNQCQGDGGPWPQQRLCLCLISPEEANKAVVTFNGRIVVSKPPYVAVAQSKVERQALLSKNFLLRMAAMRVGGNPVLNSQKAAATSTTLYQFFLSFNMEVHILTSLWSGPNLIYLRIYIVLPTQPQQHLSHSLAPADHCKFQESNQPIRSPVQLPRPWLFTLKLLPQDHVHMKKKSYRCCKCQPSKI